MNRVLQIFVIAMIACTLWSCDNRKPSAFDSLSVIEGTWLMTMDGSESGVLETWEKVNDSLYSGWSAEVSGADTTVTEYIQLMSSNNEIYYVPTVKDQNNDQPVKFKLTSSDGRRFVFENPEHDFPTAIVYNFIGNDSLVATVSGMFKGENRMLEFAYGRKH